MGDDDPFGLGDFAVFLGDDPLPTRPSILKEKEALSENFDYMNRSPGVSPTKEIPAWKFGKPKYPHITRQRVEGMEDVESIKLPCGKCECKECKLTYRSYWEEKSYSKELNRSLLEERKASEETLEEVKKMEAEYKEQLGQLRLELDVVNERSRIQEENLEFERKLRADETYRREMIDEEKRNLYISHGDLEKRLIAHNEELHRLRRENGALRDAVESSNKLRERSISQVREYEALTNALERDNAEFKTGLFQAEIENNKLKLSRDNLKQRLNSVTDFWGKPIAAPAGSGSSALAGPLMSRAGTAQTPSLTLASVAKEMRSISKISREVNSLAPVRSSVRKKGRGGHAQLGGLSLGSMSTLGDSVG